MFKNMFFLTRKIKGNNVKKERKCYVLNFIDPRIIFLKRQF